MKRNLLSLLTVLLLIFALVGCSSNKSATPEKTTNTEEVTTTEEVAPTDTATTEPSEPVVNTTDATTSDTPSTEKVFTLDELATYNGKDGMAGYVAYKGIVYDVSEVKQWKNGEHYRGVHAGIDITDLISQSPHGDKIITDLSLPVVGTLAE